MKKNPLKKNAAFGMRLKVLRQTLKMTQAEFAEQCELTQKTVSNMEAGYNSPLLENVEKIWKAYPDLSEDWLQKGIGTMFRPEHKQLSIQDRSPGKTTDHYPEIEAENDFVQEQTALQQYNLATLQREIEQGELEVKIKKDILRKLRGGNLGHSKGF